MKKESNSATGGKGDLRMKDVFRKIKQKNVEMFDSESSISRRAKGEQDYTRKINILRLILQSKTVRSIGGKPLMMGLSVSGFLSMI